MFTPQYNHLYQLLFLHACRVVTFTSGLFIQKTFFRLMVV